MKKKQILTLGTIALLSATTAPQLRAAEAEVEADVNLPRTETRLDVDRNRDADVRVRADRDVDATAEVNVNRDQNKVRAHNKASNLIGMQVRNQQNQDLGEIKDLVMENPGKVSYVVLSVGGFLGIGEKLIALPPSAVKVSPEGNYLLLDADKDTITAAPGFPATAWPNVNDPELASFWTKRNATGAPATSEQDRSSDIDVDVDRSGDRLQGEVNVDTDRKKIYTDADENKKTEIKID